MDLTAGGQAYKAGWIVDVMILPSFRGCGLGHRLYGAIAETGLALFTLTMAPATRRMAEKRGAITLPVTYQYSRLELPSARDVERYLLARTSHRPAWSKAARLIVGSRLTLPIAWSFQAMAKAKGLRARLGPDKQTNFEFVSRFGPEVDAVWRSQPDSIGGTPRTSGYLNWRFVDCPDLQYECFIARRRDRVTGYLVLRRANPAELRQGVIADALATAGLPGAWADLAAFAVDHFRDSVASIEVVASSAGPNDLLKQLGFIRTKRYDATIVCQDQSILRSLSSVTDWFFTKADHDLDQINLA